MTYLKDNLEVDKCPHCNIDKPNFTVCTYFETREHTGGFLRYWGCYQCARCGGVVTASALKNHGEIVDMFPEVKKIDDVIPASVKKFLRQAIDSQHSPDGAVMLSASAVDSMLKEKGLIEGKLYPRIKEAVKKQIITPEMSEWAHQVRLDANDSRHADEEAIDFTIEDAKNSINFAFALAEYLFVLPSKVRRGLKESSPGATAESTKSGDPIT